MTLQLPPALPECARDREGPDLPPTGRIWQSEPDFADVADNPNQFIRRNILLGGSDSQRRGPP